MQDGTPREGAVAEKVDMAQLSTELIIEICRLSRTAKDLLTRCAICKGWHAACSSSADFIWEELAHRDCESRDRTCDPDSRMRDVYG